MAMLSSLQRLFRRNLLSLYKSDADKFLANFDKQHPNKSKSQVHEIAKAKYIAELRDNPHPKDEQSKIWQDF